MFSESIDKYPKNYPSKIQLVDNSMHKETCSLLLLLTMLF